MNTMKTIYEKVEEKGLRIPLKVCRLADISNEVVIKLYKGKIEIRSAKKVIEEKFITRTPIFTSIW